MNREFRIVLSFYGKEKIFLVWIASVSVSVGVGGAFKCNTWSKFSTVEKNIICPVHFASFVCKRRKIERNQIKAFSTLL